jgi:hypothetical protein
MSWQDKMIPMLRILINDMDCTPTYSDMRLEQVLVVGAHYVKQEIDFDTTYTVTIEDPDISPDPCVTATLDDVFTNFTVLKAACLVDFSTYRTEALRSGVEARCGPAVLKVLDRLSGFRTLLNEGPCKAFEELKAEYEFGNANVCKAILSPFVGNNFDPQSLAAFPDHRGDIYG